MPNKKQCKSLEILTPHPKKQNWLERFLNRYDHIMALIRTVLAIIMVIAQYYIITQLK